MFSSAVKGGGDDEDQGRAKWVAGVPEAGNGLTVARENMLTKSFS